VDLKCFPHSYSQDVGRHLQAHLQCLQHCLKSITSFGRHIPPLLHQDIFPAHLRGPTLPSQRNDFCLLRICGGLMLQELRICLHYQRVLMTNTMQIMRVTLCRTWAGPKAKHQSACSKRNSHCSNLPKESGSLTLVR